VHNQLKADIESVKHSTDSQHPADAESNDGFSALSGDDVHQLFVKHRSGESVFFCDLGLLILFAGFPRLLENSANFT